MRILLLAAAASVLLAGCSGGGSDGDGSGDGSSSSTTTGGNQGILPQPDEVSISVAAVGAYPVNPAFDPTTLQVPAGANVTVTFRNMDSNPAIPHNWVVDGIPDAASATIDPGESDEFTFKAPAAAGTFDYYCAIGDHRSRGMEGTLSVTVS